MSYRFQNSMYTPQMGGPLQAAAQQGLPQSLLPTNGVNPMQLGIGLQNMATQRPSFLNPAYAQPMGMNPTDPNKNSTIDNIAELGGLALGTYGAYKTGQGQDKQLNMQQQQIDEENRRYEDERNRKAGAAQQLSPQVQAMLAELQKQIASQAAGAR